MALCIICNKVMEPGTRRPKKYCSKKCYRKPSTKPPLDCVICGQTILHEKQGRGPNTCSKECQRQKQNKLANARHIKKSYNNVCSECQRNYVAKNLRSKTCSEKCQYERNIRRSLEYYYKQNPKGLKEINCSWCDNPVTVPSSFTQKIVSHPECKDERYRKRQRSKSVRRRGYRAALKTMSLEQLGDRDNWTCHICQNSVDPFLPYNDRHGATVDHVMPLSRGGSDELDNLKLAHWICNIKKSNKLEWKNA